VRPNIEGFSKCFEGFPGLSHTGARQWIILMLWTTGFAKWIHARLRIDRAASSVMLKRIGVSIDQELSRLFSSHLNILHRCLL
jgi:hypothetical protein